MNENQSTSDLCYVTTGRGNAKRRFDAMEASRRYLFKAAMFLACPPLL